MCSIRQSLPTRSGTKRSFWPLHRDSLQMKGLPLTDGVRGLTAGGDDHLTKPLIGLEGLVARIRAVLRRTSAIAS